MRLIVAAVLGILASLAILGTLISAIILAGWLLSQVFA